jgi:hypothetical protein
MNQMLPRRRFVLLFFLSGSADVVDDDDYVVEGGFALLSTSFALYTITKKDQSN